MAKDRKVNILGTEYTITFENPNDREEYIKNSWSGFCSSTEPIIKIVDLTKHPEWKEESKEAIEAITKETLRHEIIHAFFNESGLKDSANVFEGAWSKNEEMIDWIAIQGAKIVNAWKEAGCL